MLKFVNTAERERPTGPGVSPAPRYVHL